MISKKIIQWYLSKKRDLPWRNTTNPYLIWLSEIILQQTRVDQGMPYYQKFVALFPEVKDLALATEAKVLHTWQGLGYYSRARNLHKTAQIIHQDFNGVFPDTYEDILKLKGIGPYTAAAIASFAFNEPKAVVDGNVYRVLARLYNIDTPINSSEGMKQFALLAQELISKQQPALHNQAIMELGALICKPAKPICEECPLILECLAYKHKTYNALPVKTPKIKVRNRYFNYYVLRHEDRMYMTQRGPKDIWQHLNEFYLIETTEETQEIELLDYMPELSIKSQNLNYKTKHLLSHQRIYATFWEVILAEIPVNLKEHFYDAEQISNLPKHKLVEKYLLANPV